MSKLLKILLLSIISLFLVSCATPAQKDSTNEADTLVTTENEEKDESDWFDADTIKKQAEKLRKEEELVELRRQNKLNQLTLAELMSARIFFDYDSSIVQDNYQNVLKQHINYLYKNPQAVLQIQGHADERGSQAYNLALGDRRGISIKRFFESNGIASDRLIVISFGETRPLDETHTESSWSLNRRVEFLYE